MEDKQHISIGKTKTCPKCGRTFPRTEEYFGVHKREKDGLDTYCRDCKRQMQRESYQRHKEHRKRKVKEYQKNSEKYKEQAKQWQEKNKDKLRSYRKEWYEANKDTVLQKQKQYYETHKEHISERSKKYAELHKDQIAVRRKQYGESHKLERSEWRKTKMENDPFWAMKQNIRFNIGNSFRRGGYSKESQACKIIGLPYEDFIPYLISKFKDTYGEEWDGKEPVHLDHIIPLATAQTKDDVIRLCHYTNLQLLKAKDNLRKGAKLNFELYGGTQ